MRSAPILLALLVMISIPGVSAETIEEVAKLVGSDLSPNERFGQRLVVSNDTVIVGADWHEHAGVVSGAAYVFVSYGTNWVEQAELLASDGMQGDSFGGAVSGYRDVAVVGAPLDDVSGMDSGSAYVFVREGTTWTEQAKLVASDVAPGDWFGVSVAVFEDTILDGSGKRIWSHRMENP